MSGQLAITAIVALIPAIVGPAPADGEAASGGLIAQLCNGGTISIPVNGQPLPPTTQPCCAKGCHSSERKRKQFDPAQSND
ncbi:hypothetical protein EB810_11675 [Altererythrobacter sp. FM1]|uniref:Secreted protein n=1 Tax=Tsuneonella flava TaxID=2055955 RepID=A0ABX7KDN5_9SPHN|nr:hypothetical protein [Tsuneonella flava]QSB44665.1 hypothetical protein IDJ81_00210 [Tsuneonella flava]ROT93776.1 hypothetical protein EB810_11675 [Altererythrobacter sp. FM1]UBS33102.1 hypothetical protein LBX01_00210 [Altererythrobacter sp. N1]